MLREETYALSQADLESTAWNVLFQESDVILIAFNRLFKNIM